MKQVSDKTIRYPIRGMLLPLDPNSNSPIFIQVNGEMLLPIFTTRDKFEAASKWGGFAFAVTNVIVNPQDFQDCVLMFKKKFAFEVAIDPYLTPEGNTRFQLVPWKEDENGES